jgi:hypothetical protein
LATRNFLTGLFLVAGFLCAFPAAATDSASPIELALFPPVQFPSTDFAVHGLRLSVVGVNRESHGIDLALLGNITNQDFKGLAISGLFNYNRVTSTIVGFQIAAGANINEASSRLYGVQIAVYNKVSTVYGLQLGLINVAHELHGIQIGLINFNEAGPFKASPIINAAF